MTMNQKNVWKKSGFLIEFHKFGGILGGFLGEMHDIMLYKSIIYNSQTWIDEGQFWEESLLVSLY